MTTFLSAEWVIWADSRCGLAKGLNHGCPATSLTFVLSLSHLFIWRSGNERMLSRTLYAVGSGDGERNGHFLLGFCCQMKTWLIELCSQRNTPQFRDSKLALTQVIMRQYVLRHDPNRRSLNQITSRHFYSFCSFLLKEQFLCILCLLSSFLFTLFLKVTEQSVENMWFLCLAFVWESWKGKMRII